MTRSSISWGCRAPVRSASSTWISCSAPPCSGATWLSRPFIISTDNARSDGVAFAGGGRFQQRFLPAPPAAFYRNTRSVATISWRWGRLSPPQSAGWWEPAASRPSQRRLRRLGWTAAAFGMQTFIRINAGLNSSCTMHAPASTARLRRSDAERALRWRSGMKGSFDQDYRWSMSSGDAGGSQPSRRGPSPRRTCGIDHYGAVRMGVAKGVGPRSDSPDPMNTRRSGSASRPVLLPAENFGGFPHKTHPGDQQRGGC